MPIELTDYKKKKLAIACSGGVDSMALAHMMAQKQKVIALIVNHNLRPAAKKEAAIAAKILTQLGIENKILEYKGKIPTKNIQEEARKIRYKLLTDFCKKHKINIIATAHHADDNAENFLLRLARGSGVDGLSAMKAESEINGIKIIRPILQFTKQELQNYLQSNKIKWVEDATNKTSKYKRNALRHVLDKLEDKELITKRINDASWHIARVRDYLESETTKALAQVVGKNEINLRNFNNLHPEIAFRVLNSVIAKFSPKPKKPRAEEVLRLLDLLKNSQKRTLAGLIFTPKNGKVFITIEKLG